MATDTTIAYRAAKADIVVALAAGQPIPDASRAQVSDRTLKRLRQHVRRHGAAPLTDNRHGHPSKMRGPICAWLEDTCRATPHIRSADLQTQIQNQFGIAVSVSHIKDIRADRGVRRRPAPVGEKSGSRPGTGLAG